MAKAFSIEESFEKLDDILEKMDSGNMSLEDTFKLYNEGIKLVKNCNSQLDKVEKKIIVLDKGGEENEL